MDSSGPGQVELSAVVMVYNGMQTLPRCLDALRACCDEVIVVDDCSTDGTWEYVQSLPIRSVRHRHTTFGAQRELGKELSRGAWVLTMDADEYVTPELAAAVWVGNRDNRPMRGIYGGQSSAPIWTDFMGPAVRIYRKFQKPADRAEEEKPKPGAKPPAESEEEEAEEPEEEEKDPEPVPIVGAGNEETLLRVKMCLDTNQLASRVTSDCDKSCD